MKELETCEAKHCLEKTREWEERLPALEESDVKTDDGNSFPDCTDNELGGEGCDQDHFVDHPTPTQLEFGEDFDEDEAPKNVLLPQEKVQGEDLGCSADGKSRRLRAKYFCSMGSKQVPPAVRCGLHLCRISRKRSQYCKRLKQKREEADALMMQSEFDAPTVKSLISCPISQFIHFAANKCGYKGT